MRNDLIAATEAAIHKVDVARFFKTERGFHGRFYCALQEQLDQMGLTENGAILEMEYQKSRRHGLSQRPDIIFHVPVEHSMAGVRENNHAVWALKRQATAKDATDDFEKLDEMFAYLDYPLGFFININALDPMLQHYSGEHRNRVVAVAASLNDGKIGTNWAMD